MDCREFREVFSDYVDGVLDGAREARALLHLSRCERCRRFERAYRSGLIALRELPSPTPSRDFGARVVNRVRHQPEPPYPAGAPALAGSLLALTIIGLFLLAPGGGRKSGLEPVAVDVAPGFAAIPAEAAGIAADVITVRVVSDDDLSPDPYPSLLSADPYVTTRIRFDVPAVWAGR